MNQSAEMLSFVTDYICNYENKIKVNNKYGLFDEAKLFELFALEICKVWFSQSFTNLNLKKENYAFLRKNRSINSRAFRSRRGCRSITPDCPSAENLKV